MKAIAVPALLIMLISLPGLGEVSTEDSGWSAAEKAIWALEARYMTLFKDGNLDGMASFYHQDFLGWPSHSIAPVNSSEGRASVEHLLQTLDVTNLEVQPRAIHIEGEIALVHYVAVLTIVADGGTSENLAFRLTHTWIREGDSWKILGGMSARIDALE